MSDLSQLKKMLEKADTSPWSAWPYTDSNIKWIHGITLSLGCPNGKGGYVQFLFTKRGKLVEAKAINPDGYECKCRYCKLPKDER